MILDIECRFFNEITRVMVYIKNFFKFRRGVLLDTGILREITGSN